MRSSRGVYLFKEKSTPRASCRLAQGAWGSYLEITLNLRRRAPEHIPRFFVKKSSDIAMSGFFLSCGLEVVYLEEVFWVMCAFLKEKVHSMSVAPEPLAIWNKKLEGLESYVVWKTAVLMKSSEWCALFRGKSALSECSPRASWWVLLSKRTWIQVLGMFSGSLLLSDVVVWWWLIVNVVCSRVV